MKTLITSETIVAYVIADVLEKVGLHPDYAETIALHEATTSRRLHLWSDWYADNCLRCSDSPMACKFLNDPEISRGNIIGVERSDGAPCPLLSPVDPTSNTDT